MKRTIISLSFAALVTAGLAAAQPGSEESNLDRTLPTYPELGFDGWRNNSGDSEKDNAVQVQIASDGYRNESGDSEKDNAVQVQIADAYRFNAGESTQDLVVQDVGSA
jgi:hypothetical protein